MEPLPEHCHDHDKGQVVEQLEPRGAAAMAVLNRPQRGRGDPGDPGSAQVVSGHGPFRKRGHAIRFQVLSLIPMGITGLVLGLIAIAIS